jgi:hypothetical protein
MDMNLFVVAGGIGLILVLISLVLFGIGFFVKAAKRILWVLAILLLLAAGWVIFF